jgi:hypothetical protein
LIVAPAALALAVAPAFAAAQPAATTPTALYKALLIPVKGAQLPAGFSSPKTAAITPGGNIKLHHAVGQVNVYLNGGNTNGIVYGVYPTHADAIGSHAAAVKGIKAQGVTTRPASGSIPKPSALFRADGMTQIAFVVGNVEIIALTTRGADDALSLARFALKHLNAAK